MPTGKQLDEAPASRVRKPVLERWYYEPVSQPAQHDSQSSALALVLGLPSVSVGTRASIALGSGLAGSHRRWGTMASRLVLSLLLF